MKAGGVAGGSPGAVVSRAGRGGFAGRAVPAGAVKAMAVAVATAGRGRRAGPGGARRRSVAAGAKKVKADDRVSYGNSWYERTRNFADARSRESATTQLERYRRANREANNGRERKDLYTDKWDGDVYKGSPFNLLTLLAVLFVAVPALGLVFAYQTYGVLWG